jgi:DNA-binding protein H-NS
MALKSMTIDKLVKLKADIEAVLATKIKEERHSLEAELSKLGRFGAREGSKDKRAGVSIAPKYRNPKNPAETWAGRGLRPRWLTAALKSGVTLEDFAISAPVTKGRGTRSGKGRKKTQR